VDLLRAEFPMGGFEWGALQYAHVDNSWMLPLARLAGGRLLTLFTVLLGAGLVHVVLVALKRGAEGSSGPITDQLRRGLPDARGATFGLVAVLLVTAVGVIEPPEPSGVEIDVLVVQGNDLERSWRGMSALEVDRYFANNYLELTRDAIGNGPVPDLVVWPENAFDRDPWHPEGADLLPIAREAGALTGGRLLAGVNKIGPRPLTFENSQVLIGADGQPDARYAKQRYVPFGEYVPFRSILGGFPPLRKVPRDGHAIEVGDAVEVGPARIAAAICFESLFGELIRHNINVGDQPANLIVVSASDASFGRTGEPEQHLAQSRMRAVETGRWLVHATTSGLTTLVAPDGSVSERTELFTLATQRHTVPLVDDPTPYLRWGSVLDLPLWLGLAALIAWAFLQPRRARAGAAADRQPSGRL
jgi:apolipoprotein N-acyltransferase